MFNTVEWLIAVQTRNPFCLKSYSHYYRKQLHALAIIIYVVCCDSTAQMYAVRCGKVEIC